MQLEDNNLEQTPKDPQARSYHNPDFIPNLFRAVAGVPLLIVVNGAGRKSTMADESIGFTLVLIFASIFFAPSALAFSKISMSRQAQPSIHGSGFVSRGITLPNLLYGAPMYAVLWVMLYYVSPSSINFDL
jgi:hypothetical protein